MVSGQRSEREVGDQGKRVSRELRGVIVQLSLDGYFNRYRKGGK